MGLLLRTGPVPHTRLATAATACVLAFVATLLSMVGPAAADRVPHITGTIVDLSGNPVAGVKIWTTGYEPAALTGAGGHFDVLKAEPQYAPLGLTHGNLPAGVVYADGQVDTPADGTDANVGAVQLAAVMPTSVQVVDADGDPVTTAELGGFTVIDDTPEPPVNGYRRGRLVYSVGDGGGGSSAPRLRADWYGRIQFDASSAFFPSGFTPGLVASATNTSGDTFTQDMSTATYAAATNMWALVMDDIDVPALQSPSPPENVRAVRGNRSATVFWQRGPGTVPATGYTVTILPDGPSFDVSGPVTQRVVSGLTNGHTYQFQVVAHSEVGDSAPSVLSEPVTPASAPGPLPAAPKVTVTRTAVKVSWSVPADTGGISLSSYRVFLDGKLARATQGTSTQLRTKTLKAGKHRVAVAAVNAVGAGPTSPPRTFRITR